jgi:hypothetical protein
MNQRVAPPDVVRALKGTGTISAENVLTLRREVFRDGVVDRAEAEAVFDLDESCPGKALEWNAFYIEALTDYFVWRSEPRKYIDEAKADFLIDHVVRDGKIASATELELLVNVIHWSVSCPERLRVLALTAVRDSVLHPDAAAYGEGRRPGVIDNADVALLTKVLYAEGGMGGITISRDEADLLFELNTKTDEAANAPAWKDLFVKGVANFLMLPQGAPVVPSASEARARERWEESSRGVGEILKAVGQNIASLDYGRLWREADIFGGRAREVEAEHEAAALAEARRREAIDEPEAKWLLDWLDADASLSDNERALLRFIKDNATATPPSLDRLFARV